MPFTAGVASNGQSRCRECAKVIAKDSWKVGVSCRSSGWGRKFITAHHHLACFVHHLRVEVCASSRGRCKCSGATFTKGSLRFAYCTIGADEPAWLNLESATSLLRPLIQKVPEWTPQQLVGFQELPTVALQAQVEQAFVQTGADIAVGGMPATDTKKEEAAEVDTKKKVMGFGSWSFRHSGPGVRINIDLDDDL